MADAGVLGVIVGVVALALWQAGGSRPAAANPGAVVSDAGCTAGQLAANDDGSSPTAVPMGLSINFFGTTFSTVYVNNNGNVTFSSGLSAYTPQPIGGTGFPIIAPFWADVDTRGAGSAVVKYGATTFGGRPAFCANWVNVGYFGSHADKLNSFQLVLVDRSDIGVGDFDLIMNYDHVLWETGDFSGGQNGFGGTSARMGYSNGTNISFEYPGSASPGSFLDGSASGLARNSRNSLVLGRYVFEVRNGAPPSGGAITGRVVGPPPPAPQSGGDGLVPLEGALVTVCGTPPCATTSTNAEGRFLVTGLAPGDYHVIAYPPAGRTDILPADAAVTLPPGESIDVGDLGARRPVPPPEGVIIDRIGIVSGVPVLRWNAVTPFSVPGCEGGSASFRLIAPDGRVLASGPLSETSPGRYFGYIPGLLPYHGPARVEVDIICPDGPPEAVDFDVYIDPSGVVKTVGGTPIAGATVTLLRSDSSGGPFEIVADGSAIMSPSNRANPDQTNAEGGFHWDVIAGYYKVRAEAEGCADPLDSGQAYVETEVMEIPPPVTDLDIRLDCGAEPTPSPSPTAPPGISVQVQWGDVDCSGVLTIGDAQKLARSLVDLPITQTPPCPAVEQPLDVEGISVLDCSGGVDIGDAQKLSRSLIGLSVNQAQGCPQPGAPISVGAVVRRWEHAGMAMNLDGVVRLWGDLDCSGAVNIGDAQKLSRSLIGLSVNQAPGCPGPQDQVTLAQSAGPRRAVLYITGIASEGNCFTPALDHPDLPGWRWISDPLMEGGGIAAGDFLEYIYRDGEDAAPVCSSPNDPTRFDRHDSCWSLDNSIDSDVGGSLRNPPAGSGPPKGQAEKLKNFIKAYLRDHAGVQLSIIAHSQGGVLAAYTLARYRSDPDIAKVSSLVTLDSPLQGIRTLAGTDLGISQVRSWAFGCDGDDDKRYDSIWDMLPGRAVINEITYPGNWPNDTSLYTVNEKGADCFGPLCIELIPDSESKFGWELGHIGVNTGGHAKLANGSGDREATNKVVAFIKCAILGPPPGANADCQDATYTIEGTVYVDGNGNGARDAGEAPYINATVELAGTGTTTTDILGHYSFSGLPGGNQTVRLVMPAGYEATTTNPVNVSIASNSTVNFGLAPLPTPTPCTQPSVDSRALAAVIDLASRLSVCRDKIAVTEIREISWPSSCRWVPPGTVCLQIVTHGLAIRLRDQRSGVIYAYFASCTGGDLGYLGSENSLPAALPASDPGACSS
ncbi:MAG: SdrD B-like domain-containing protein [Dehalococcoidia bacterium]|nr:SdrD B-like domain-containing protein [Dehalococcoidia bacterium]